MEATAKPSQLLAVKLQDRFVPARKLLKPTEISKKGGPGTSFLSFKRKAFRADLRITSSSVPPTLTLTNKPNDTQVEIPRVGLGVFQVTPEETEAAVKTALAQGYRHIDTASIYKNEAQVGKAVAESGVPREDLFVTTKLWMADFGFDKALRAVDKSLENLGLTFVDLYLVHVVPPPELRRETWEAMEHILEQGKARAIGVCNHGAHHLEELMGHCSLRPAVNQIELHPFNSKPKLVGFCQDNGIALEAFSPLTRGQKLNHPTIMEVAARYQKSAAQVLVRWGLQRGFIVLPKSITPARIAENMNVFGFEITPEDMEKLNGLDENFLAVGWDPTVTP